jgi:hypothetical protein
MSSPDVRKGNGALRAASIKGKYRPGGNADEIAI